MGKNHDIVRARIAAAPSQGTGAHSVRGGKGIDDQGPARLVHHLEHAYPQAAPELPVAAEVRNQLLSDVDLGGEQKFHGFRLPDVRGGVR